jgi:hypothetical protein
MMLLKYNFSEYWMKRKEQTYARKQTEVPGGSSAGNTGNERRLKLQQRLLVGSQLWHNCKL